jgi:hypothetical protein
LNLRYDPATDRLDGVATITATATQNLSSFDLDLQGLTATEVSVNDAPAAFRQDGQELVITPRHGLLKSRSFEVSVRYGGVPQPLDGPIVFGLPYGWIATDDGAFVACEPNAASTWFPSNDHPSDKATFTFRVTVPRGLYVVANGVLVNEIPHGDLTTFVWNEGRPMATYLATTTIGFTVQRGTTPGGIPEIVVTDPSLPGPAPTEPDLFAVTAAATDYWSQLRAVPVRGDRRHSRQHAHRRVFAGDADQADLLGAAQRDHDRARAVPPMVRRQRVGANLEQHLAQRGVRDLRAVVVGREQGDAQRA